MFFPELLLFTSLQLNIIFLWDYWSKFLLRIKEQKKTGQLKKQVSARYLPNVLLSRLTCPFSTRIISFLPIPRYGYCWERGSLRSHRPTLLWWDTPIHCRAKTQIKWLTPELQRVLTSWGTAMLSSSRSLSWSADLPKVKGQHHAQAAVPPAERPR
jgi:hypothetical protein